MGTMIDQTRHVSRPPTAPPRTDPGDNAAVLGPCLADGEQSGFGGVEGGVIRPRHRLGAEAVVGEQPGGVEFLAGAGQAFANRIWHYKRTPWALAIRTSGRSAARHESAL